MPKRLTNEEKSRRIDLHNEKISRKASRELQKEIERITKTFISYATEINKKNLITKK